MRRSCRVRVLHIHTEGQRHTLILLTITITSYFYVHLQQYSVSLGRDSKDREDYQTIRIYSLFSLHQLDLFLYGIVTVWQIVKSKETFSCHSLYVQQNRVCQ